MAEKEINEISRDARVLYTKATEAAQRENYDYAIALYNQVLEKEPGFFDGRKALREIQGRKAGGGGGFFKKMLSGASSSPLVAKGQLALRNNPGGALAIAEQILNSDPNSTAGHRLIVQAAQALELPRTGVMSLEILVKNSPKDKCLAVEFANSLVVGGGDTRRAEQVLMELLRSSPNDGELGQALKDLSARKTLDEGGYGALEGGKGSYRDILKDKKEAVSLEQEKRVVKSEDTTERLINEYETRLQTEPENLKLIRSLAELYTQKINSTAPWNFTAASRIPTWAATRHSNSPWPKLSCAVRLSIGATRPRRARLRGTVGQNPGREVKLPAHRMPEARGKIPDRPRHPV
jgi:tetratricopeptide (TPR) repeat protein